MLNRSGVTVTPSNRDTTPCRCDDRAKIGGTTFPANPVTHLKQSGFIASHRTASFLVRPKAALKNRQKHFAIDGEAVVLSVDGISDFNSLHSRKHEEEVQLYAFDIWP